MDWYVAKSPRFSYYAVGFAENVTRLPAEIFTPTPTATIEVVTVPTTAATASPTVPTAPQQSPSFVFSGVLSMVGVAVLSWHR